MSIAESTTMMVVSYNKFYPITRKAKGMKKKDFLLTSQFSPNDVTKPQL